MKSCLIHYFSGTGGTHHAVKTLGNHLGQKDYEVTYIQMENPPDINLNDFELNIFAYPIYGFGTPALVIRYIKALHNVSSSKAVILSICAGFEGQSLYHVSGILRRKGFDVYYNNSVFYPSNWTQFFNPESEEKQRQIVETAKSHINNIVEEIAQHTHFMVKRSALSLFLSSSVYFLYSQIGRRMLGKVYTADNNCNGCSKCQRQCPSHSIKMIKNKPRWNWNCEGCNRCINLCPNKSIQTSPLRFVMLILTDIAPILVLIWLNKDLNFSIGEKILSYTFVYILLNILLKVLADGTITMLESIPSLRKLFSASFTQKFRRYYINEFDETIKQ